jgi:hypothetical protein
MVVNPNNRLLIRFRLKGLSAIAYEERKFLKHALFSFRARDPQSLATVIQPPAVADAKASAENGALPQARRRRFKWRLVTRVLGLPL